MQQKKNKLIYEGSRSFYEHISADENMTLQKSKIKAKSEIFKYNEIDEFINFLNKYSSNSTIILATRKDIGKPGPLIDKLIYEKSNSLHCPLVIINGNLDDKDIEKII